MSAEAGELIKAGAKEIKNPSPQQIQEAFANIESGIKDMINKISELDQEVGWWSWGVVRGNFVRTSSTITRFARRYGSS